MDRQNYEVWYVPVGFPQFPKVFDEITRNLQIVNFSAIEVSVEVRIPWQIFYVPASEYVILLRFDCREYSMFYVLIGHNSKQKLVLIRAKLSVLFLFTSSGYLFAIFNFYQWD